ncbi:hypothetical protein BpHYR1_025817 [Brachionus plicatilis]|uniref:Uncharacterized protein n=1 Tax=Brachionus plicatilis TaxID=10195 RepID=A0A3M7P2X3_BRAPC|nr:hypothetical protein BpHYR1_025817 [Brachionus plicatilis]
MLIFLLALLLSACNGSHLNRSDDEVVSWKFGSPIRPRNSSVEFELKFFAPTKPGNYLTAVFLTGLDGMASGSFYTAKIS